MLIRRKMNSSRCLVCFLWLNWYQVAYCQPAINVTYLKTQSLYRFGISLESHFTFSQSKAACLVKCILTPGCSLLNVISNGSNLTASKWECKYFIQKVPENCQSNNKFATSTLKITKGILANEALLRLTSVMKSCDDYASHGETKNGIYNVVLNKMVVPIYCEFGSDGGSMVKSCDDLASRGARKTGIYGFIFNKTIIPINCIFDSDGVWTLLQNRFDGSVDFYRDWNDYKKGFGDIGGEFWLGNDIIHELTKNDDKSVRFVLGDLDETRYADYDEFKIENENQQYTLRISGYSGTAGDSIGSRSMNQKFSTMDMDNDLKSSSSCSLTYKTAWWMGAPCFSSSLNGQYHQGSGAPAANGIIWSAWKGESYSLYSSQIMIKSQS